MINNVIRALLLIGLTAIFNISVYAAPIGRTITINGDMSDWETPTNITTNPGQFSTDEEGDASTGSIADLDFEVQSVGRDLKRFSYTYDNTNLYMWVSRFASSTNITDWWFYLDIDSDGLMESGEKMLRVSWRGSNGNTTVELYNYIANQSGGDSMVCQAIGPNSVADGWCPIAGTADGYDMPGTQNTTDFLNKCQPDPSAKNYCNGDVQDQHGGGTSGVEMETRISWAILGLSGPSSIGFHISSSNGANIPTQVNDNMNGAGGGGGSIAFSELAVTKTANVSSVNAGSIFTYNVTVTNNGDSSATNVSLDDILPAEVTYVSHVAPSGTTYDNTTGLWTIGSLPFLASPANTKTLSITVSANGVATNTVVTNTANNLQLDQADPNITNNQASVDVTVIAVPEISLQKTSITISDPINGTSNPKAIPGSLAEYTIEATNSGLVAADNDSITISDVIPSNTALYVIDTGSGIVRFVDGSTPSGLSIDSVSYFDSGGASIPPTPDGDGVNTNVSSITVTTQGQFQASSASGDPSFKLLFRVKVQ